jgi:hypothetical protein
MTDASIFDAKEDQTVVSQPAETNAGEESLLSALVGETQKYKSVDELAKAYANADSFIEQLKEENRKLREQAAKAKTIDEVLERINHKAVPEEDKPAVSGINPEDVQKLVEQTLSGREVKQRREANLLAADKAMKERFGEKAAEVFKQRASSPEKAKVLMELAATDPQEFVNLFGGVTSTPTQNIDTSSVSTALTLQSGNRAKQEGTKEWAASVRKENPSLYWSHEFQYKLQQMVSKNPSLYFGA